MDNIENLIEDNVKIVHSIVSSYSYGRSYLKDELESELMLELWEAIKDFEDDRGVKLSTYAYKRLNRQAQDIVDPTKRRNTSYYHRLVAPTTLSDGEEVNLLDSIESPEQTDLLQTKEADQRQLIDSLINDPSQVDTETIEIVTAFPRYNSITALAKALGLHHEVVKRKLRKLERNFCETTFGDYRQYLSA